MSNKKSSASTSKGLDVSELREWLDGKFNLVTEQNEKQEQTLNKIDHRLEVLEGESFSARQVAEKLEKENTALKKEVEGLKSELEQLDALQRRDNLRFFNIPEQQGEDVYETAKAFMTDKLHLDGQNIDLSIAYRIGSLSNVNNRPRCILARFVRRRDVGRVKAAASNLRGTTFGISDDLPPTWAAARKKAHKTFVIPARKNKQKVRWQGATLMIDGKMMDLEQQDSDTNIKKNSTQASTSAGTSDTEDSNTVQPSDSASTVTITQSLVDRFVNYNREAGPSKNTRGKKK